MSTVNLKALGEAVAQVLLKEHRSFSVEVETWHHGLKGWASYEPETTIIIWDGQMSFRGKTPDEALARFLAAWRPAEGIAVPEAVEVA